MLQIALKMECVRCDNDDVIAIVQPHDLKAPRMTADEMDSEPLHNLAVPVVEAHPAGKRQADRIDYGVHCKGTPKTIMAHASSCTVGHLPILQVEQGFGEVRKVSRVIIVKMRDDDVGNGRCGNPELAKRLDRMDQHGPPAPFSLLRAKPGVNQDQTFTMADQPNEILDPARGVVGISCFQAEFANGPNRSAVMYRQDFPVGQILAPSAGSRNQQMPDHLATV
jgi:hypothetical protein